MYDIASLWKSFVYTEKEKEENLFMRKKSSFKLYFFFYYISKLIMKRICWIDHLVSL